MCPLFSPSTWSRSQKPWRGLLPIFSSPSDGFWKLLCDQAEGRHHPKHHRHCHCHRQFIAFYHLRHHHRRRHHPPVASESFCPTEEQVGIRRNSNKTRFQHYWNLYLSQILNNLAPAHVVRKLIKIVLGTTNPRHWILWLIQLIQVQYRSFNKL